MKVIFLMFVRIGFALPAVAPNLPCPYDGNITLMPPMHVHPFGDRALVVPVDLSAITLDELDTGLTPQFNEVCRSLLPSMLLEVCTTQTLAVLHAALVSICNTGPTSSPVISWPLSAGSISFESADHRFTKATKQTK